MAYVSNRTPLPGLPEGHPLTIMPTNFYVPPEIQAGLDAGELFRFGGVVRNGLGQIVKHLKELPATPEVQEAVARRLAANLKHHKGVVVLCLSAVGAAVGGRAYVSARRRREAQVCVDRYEASLRCYLEALRASTLDAAAITRLIRDLDAVRSLARKGAITVDFSTEPSVTLINLVIDYTNQLAEANDSDLDELQNLAPTDGSNAIAYLRRHLVAQRRIFAEAA